MSTKQVKVSQRNLFWLIAVIAVAVVGFLASGWKVALVAAVIVLVLSEVVERQARRKRSTAP